MEKLLERPEITSFISTWKDKPQKQVVEELASYSLETKRIPDPYRFLVDKEGDLFSPSAGCKVKSIIRDESAIGRLEAEAFDFISTWVKEQDSGTIAWISPPCQGIYSTSKIIISQIEQKNNEKRLSNTAIVLDFDENECLKLAQGLTQYSSNYQLFNHPDMLRANPLILNTKGIHWTYILGEFIDAPQVWGAIRRGDDKIAKKDAITKAHTIYQALFGGLAGLQDAKIMVLDMLGNKSGSCPVLFTGTTFQIFSGSSLTISIGSFDSDKYGSLEFDCPHADCGKKNRRPYGQLIPNCQHCGKSVRC